MTEFALSSEESQALNEIPPIPWDVLDSAEHRTMLLTDSESFSPFKTLDPYRMSVTEMYDILNLITIAQDEENYILKFNINNKIVEDLISSYCAVNPDDIVELTDPPPTLATKRSQANSRKKTILDSDSKSDSSIGSVPDFSPPSNLRTSLPVNEVSGTFSPVRVITTPTFPTEQVDRDSETRFLPEDIIVSALHAVAAHNSSIKPPTSTASNTTPLDPNTEITAVPSSSDIRSGQKRPRTDSEQLESSPNEPAGGQAIKRVRLAEQPNNLSLSPPTVAVASANATPMTKSKETKPTSRGAKRGLKSKVGAATEPSVLGADLDEKKEKKTRKPVAKSSKLPPPPPRQASKRYAAS